MKKVDGVYSAGAKERRRRVIQRLETQLKTGKKPNPENQNELIALEAKDKERIEREIETLKSRI